MNDTIKGKYRITREIARSNDIVYEAVDTSLQRRLALKELNIAPGMTGQAKRERVERFSREARAAGKLSHSNIVHIYDHWEENGRYFIAMEYLEGQTLRDVMQARGVMSLKEAVEIACQTLDALAHAHQHKVIHRDIKPDNIHILPNGSVKLTDFGIARLSEEPALTSNGQVFGTPSYMSPEQIEGKHIDHRSDLFSVGVLLYEMLAGRKPFTGDSVISITYAIMNADAPALHGVPQGVEQVIRRALSKRPEQRQLSADQMRQDLRNAEQTPAVFLPSQSSGIYLRRTNMAGNGNTNNPALNAPSGYGGSMPTPPNAYGARNGYTGSNNYPNQNGGYGSPQGVPDPQYANNSNGMSGMAPNGAVSPDANGLPWNWNTPGSPQPGQTRAQRRVSRAAGQSASLAAMQAQNAAQYAQNGQMASSVNGYASPPHAVPPRQPMIVLSPAAKSNLMAVAVAVVIGCALAFGIVGFMNRYQSFQSSVSSEKVHTLMTQAAHAYSNQDYVGAAPLFEQALAAKPAASDLSTIQTSLGYTYVQLARQAKNAGNTQESLADYTKAIGYAPDYKVAHEELSVLKESLNDPQGARTEREAAQGSTSTQSPPAALTPPPPVSLNGSPATPAADPNQLLRTKSDQAQQLLKEGDQLLQNNDTRGALSKWRDARDAAPGLPEHDQAQDRIDKYDGMGAGG